MLESILILLLAREYPFGSSLLTESYFFAVNVFTRFKRGVRSAMFKIK